MNDHDEESRKAKRDLERLAGEGNISSSPVLKSASKTLKDHFSASDADQTDKAEIWGTRIARLLAAIAFIGLSFWLFNMLTTNP